MPSKWVARNSDGMWMVKGAGDPALLHSQPANYTLVALVGDECPDERLTRYDPANPSVPRAATAAEITAFDAARISARAQTSSRQKDIYAMCGLVARLRAGTVTWGNMTIAQKVAATNAEADAWKVIREFVEDKA